MNNDLISREALKAATKSFTDSDGFNPIWQIIDNASTINLKDIYQEGHYDGHLDGYTKAMNEERPQGKWTPITYRPMTEEEVKRVETYFGVPLFEKEKRCFSCPMPEHGQEILISTKWGVSKDICLYDCDEGYSLDERGDWEDVDAWMPLPEKYDGADMRGGEE